jgi:hypothetical protein
MRRLALRTSALTLLLGLTILAAEAASIVVAPTAVYIDHQTRSASVTLFNPGDTAEEVTIDAVFGYPATADDGTLYLHLDPDTDDPRSAAPWLRAFPRQVMVPPGARQVVRLLGEPPADLPDGEYWSRLVVTSRGQSIPVDAPPGSQGVRVGLDLEVRTVIAATYRKGAVDTGLDVGALDALVTDGSLRLRPRLVRQGSAAWIGTLRLALHDASGTEVRSWTEQVAVYEVYHRAFSYDVRDLPPGSYTLRAVFSTNRDDIPAAFRLPTADQVHVAGVVVP